MNITRRGLFGLGFGAGLAALVGRGAPPPPPPAVELTAPSFTLAEFEVHPITYWTEDHPVFFKPTSNYARIADDLFRAHLEGVEQVATTHRRIGSA